jgi:Icc-related predicted phosphoesterase
MEKTKCYCGHTTYCDCGPESGLTMLHISDTHGFHDHFPKERFEEVDIVVHSGDCSNYRDVVRNEAEVIDFIDWYSKVPVAHKIYVAGNHDTSIERNRVTKEDFEKAGIIYLENSDVIIGGVKFWGSPHTPTFGDWAFMKSRETIGRTWEHIPFDTDVLIVHGPPKGIRDLSFDRHGQLEYCGDGALLKAILKVDPQYMLFGHIHDMTGAHNQGVSTFHKISTVFSNATCVDDGKFELGLTSFGNKFKL